MIIPASPSLIQQRVGVFGRGFLSKHRREENNSNKVMKFIEITRIFTFFRLTYSAAGGRIWERLPVETQM